jgi:hypothetical protein
MREAKGFTAGGAGRVGIAVPVTPGTFPASGHLILCIRGFRLRYRRSA